MKILTESDLPLTEPVAVALGFFDGIHDGHRRLLTLLNEQPQASLVYTLDRKPNVPKPLFSVDERAAIMDAEGVDYYYAAPFDVTFRDLSPRTFLRRLMRELNVKTIVVGSDFRFGSEAAGDVDLLEQMRAKYKYRLVVVPVEEDTDGKLSSSRLRKLVREGNVEEAAQQMGAYYFVDGTVEHGSRLGKKIGFPTANIVPDKILPAHGVYATLTRTEQGVFPSVTNVGNRPTVDDGDLVNVETNLLDHDEELYGQKIRVYFVKRMRPEKRFAGMDELKEQIERDAEQARQILSDPSIYSAHELC